MYSSCSFLLASQERHDMSHGESLTAWNNGVNNKNFMVLKNGSNRSRSVREIYHPVFPALLLSIFLSACSPPDTATSSFAPRDVGDPAMATQPAVVVQQVDEGAMPEAQVLAVAAIVPEVPRLDETGEKIFIPELGWLPTAEFMDMYENRPEQLPHSLDLFAIHEIKQELKNRG